MIFFQNCIIQIEKTYFCILAKGKSSDQSICFLKSSYFCVLHSILGKRKLIFTIFVFQLTLMEVTKKISMKPTRMKLHFCEAIEIEIWNCQWSVQKALRKCEKYWRKCWKVSSMRVLISCWEGVEKVYSKWMGVKVLDRLSPLKAGYSLCRKFSIHQVGLQ